MRTGNAGRLGHGDGRLVLEQRLLEHVSRGRPERSGVVTINSEQPEGRRRRRCVTFCVTNVTHSTITYDNLANVETCDGVAVTWAARGRHRRCEPTRRVQTEIARSRSRRSPARQSGLGPLRATGGEETGLPVDAAVDRDEANVRRNAAAPARKAAGCHAPSGRRPEVRSSRSPAVARAATAARSRGRRSRSGCRAGSPGARAAARPRDRCVGAATPRPARPRRTRRRAGRARGTRGRSAVATPECAAEHGRARKRRARPAPGTRSAGTARAPASRAAAGTPRQSCS